MSVKRHVTPRRTTSRHVAQRRATSRHVRQRQAVTRQAIYYMSSHAVYRQIMSEDDLVPSFSRPGHIKRQVLHLEATREYSRVIKKSFHECAPTFSLENVGHTLSLYHLCQDSKNTIWILTDLF